MADAGWFADPTGRFGQRWYDGSTWTKNVVGAGGGVIDDELPESDSPFAPPSPTGPPPSPAVPPPPGPMGGPNPQNPPSGFPPPGAYNPNPPTAGPGVEVRYGVGAGLVIGLVGLVLVALSLFAISWTDADKSRFTDFTSSVNKLHPTSFPDFGVHLYYLYLSWLSYVLFGAVLVLTVLAGIPVPHTGIGNRIWRIIASLLAGIALMIHSVTITYVFVNSGQTAGFGALSAMFGYAIVMIAMIFGARRIVRPPVRSY